MMGFPIDITFEEYEDLIRANTGDKRERVLSVAKHDANLTPQQWDRLRDLAWGFHRRGIQQMDLDTTLREAVMDYPDTLCYIGSHAGFFYIGPGRDAADALNIIERYYIRSFDKSVQNAAKSVEYAWLRTRDALGEKDVENAERMLAEAKKHLVDAANRLNSFTPLLDRHVVDIYNRTVYTPGKVILVEGPETGFAWFLEEYTEGVEKISAEFGAEQGE